ncbi:MAG: translation initiation factor eIF-2B [Halobacteriales archaeon]
MIDETVEEIREMQTHSSSVVAVRAAEALRELLDREFATVAEYERDLERNSSALRRANPSHASLWTTQRRIVREVTEGDAGTVEEAKAVTADAIDRVVSDVEDAKDAAAANLADRLEDGETILTHDYSTTVLEGIERATADGATFEVFVTEARPRFQGRRTARTLAGIEGVDPTLVVDGAAGHYLPECDRILVGMDCVVGDTLYNRVGTYPLAATAADAGVPVVVAGSSTKLIDGGFRFENDFRSPIEVLREPSEGFEVGNPSYDATPTRLVDRVITDDGTGEL